MSCIINLNPKQHFFLIQIHFCKSRLKKIKLYLRTNYILGEKRNKYKFEDKPEKPIFASLKNITKLNGCRMYVDIITGEKLLSI